MFLTDQHNHQRTICCRVTFTYGTIIIITDDIHPSTIITTTLIVAANGSSFLIRLEEHEVNKHEGAEERRLGLDVEVVGKVDAEVVGVGEGLA